MWLLSGRTNLFVEVKIIVVEQMNKVLDRRHRRVLAVSEALVSFSLLSASDEALDLDDLLHILFEETLFLSELCTNKRCLCSGFKCNDRFCFASKFILRSRSGIEYRTRTEADQSIAD